MDWHYDFNILFNKRTQKHSRNKDTQDGIAIMLGV